VTGRQPSARDQPLAALRRFVRRPAAQAAVEKCEMCGQEIAPDHSHVVNIESRSLMCACRACYLLFTQPGAAQGKYKAVPDRYLYLRLFALSPERWEELQIPVGMAFFFFNTALGRVTGFYPSPAGATESMLPLDAWEGLKASNPILESMEPDVEALLVRRARDQHFECFLVPIDACYELTGIVRRRWRGFDGGEEARRDIDAFFDALRGKCRPVEEVEESA
jgi:Family of unknown function (DUF5947)